MLPTSLYLFSYLKLKVALRLATVLDFLFAEASRTLSKSLRQSSRNVDILLKDMTSYI